MKNEKRLLTPPLIVLIGLIAFSSSLIGKEQPLYTFDINKYKGDQNEYQQKVSKIVSNEVQRLKSSKVTYNLAKERFEDLLDLYGDLRHEIAKKNGSVDAEAFGQRRNVINTAYALTPLNHQYIEYGYLLFDKLSLFLKSPWESEKTVCHLLDSEIIEGYQSLLTLEVIPGATVKKRAEQGEILSIIVHEKRDEIPDIVLGTLKLIKKDPVTQEIKTEHQVLQQVLAKRTENNLSYDLRKDNIDFITRTDRQVIFNPAIPYIDLLLKEEAAPCFARALTWNGKDLLELQEMVAFLRYLLAVGTPYQRGSAAISEWIEKVIYEYHGYDIKLVPGRLVDLEALVALKLSDFVRTYQEIVILTKKLDFKEN